MLLHRRRADEDVVRRPLVHWSPAQLVALGIGVGSIVLGVYALTRTGLSTSHLYEPHRSVWRLEHTPLLGVLEVAFGVLLALTAFAPIAGRAPMALLSACAVAFGVIILADVWPARLAHWLGVHHRHGWLYVIAGGIALLAAIVSPVVTHSRVVHIEREREPIE